MSCHPQVRALWDMFLGVDATQLEINPLIETPQGAVVAVDAKIAFDDNAKYRRVGRKQRGHCFHSF